MGIHVYFHTEPDAGVTARLDQVLTLLQELATMANTTAQQIKDAADATLAAITDESSKDDSIIALVTANNAQLADLKTQLEAAIAALPSGTDATLLDAALASLTAAQASATANSAKVLAAINANTPSAAGGTPGANL